MSFIITFIIAALYNLTLLGGTAYLVVNYQWSPWWFLLTAFLLANASSKSDKEEKINE